MIVNIIGIIVIAYDVAAANSFRGCIRGVLFGRQRELQRGVSIGREGPYKPFVTVHVGPDSPDNAVAIYPSDARSPGHLSGGVLKGGVGRTG